MYLSDTVTDADTDTVYSYNYAYYYLIGPIASYVTLWGKAGQLQQLHRYWSMCLNDSTAVTDNADPPADPHTLNRLGILILHQRVSYCRAFSTVA